VVFIEISLFFWDSQSNNKPYKKKTKKKQVCISFCNSKSDKCLKIFVKAFCSAGLKSKASMQVFSSASFPGCYEVLRLKTLISGL